MKIKKTESGKISMKMSWNDYCSFCYLASNLTEMTSEYNKNKLESERDVLDRMYYLEFMGIHKRLVKSDTYPLNQHCVKKEKVTVTLELQEALVVWFWITANIGLKILWPLRPCGFKSRPRY